MSPQRRRSAIARTTIGLSLVALVLAGALGLVVSQPSSLMRPVTTTVRGTTTLTSTETVTSTGTSTTTATSTTTSTTTVTSVSTQSVTETLPEGCSGSTASGYFGTLDVGTSSPATICLQLYEFDATSPITVDPAGLIAISGSDPVSGRPIYGASLNFTITSSSSSVDLGGPTDANEGILVALYITAKPGASGAYWAEVEQGVLQGALGGGQPGLYLTSQGGEEGGPNGVLVAGTGQPDYVPSNVIEMPIYLDCTSAFHIQGYAFDICPDMLYYRLIAATNSTG
jgi:hypothetical protein